MASQFTREPVRASPQVGQTARSRARSGFGSGTNACSTDCPAPLVMREPVSLHVKPGSTQSAPFSLTLPSTTGTLFSSLNSDQSVPVRVRILLPAAAKPRHVAKATVTVKAEPGTSTAVGASHHVIKQEPSAGEVADTIHQRDQQHHHQQQTRAHGTSAATVTMVMMAEFDAHMTCTKTYSRHRGSSSNSPDHSRSNRSYSLVGLPSSMNRYQDWIICVIQKVHAQECLNVIVYLLQLVPFASEMALNSSRLQLSGSSSDCPCSDVHSIF